MGGINLAHRPTNLADRSYGKGIAIRARVDDAPGYLDIGCGTGYDSYASLPFIGFRFSGYSASLQVAVTRHFNGETATGGYIYLGDCRNQVVEAATYSTGSSFVMQARKVGGQWSLPATAPEADAVLSQASVFIASPNVDMGLVNICGPMSFYTEV